MANNQAKCTTLTTMRDNETLLLQKQVSDFEIISSCKSEFGFQIFIEFAN